MLFLSIISTASKGSSNYGGKVIVVLLNICLSAALILMQSVSLNFLWTGFFRSVFIVVDAVSLWEGITALSIVSRSSSKASSAVEYSGYFMIPLLLAAIKIL